MRILCTNDDGIHAPGLQVIEEIAKQISDDVWVIAPELDQSGVSHSLSLNDPLRLREVDDRHFSVRGTPTDCVIMGARHILKDRQPDIVLSGVNRGRNVAEDVVYSGTIAGALEGTILGLPSFALSQGVSQIGRGTDQTVALDFGDMAVSRQNHAAIAYDPVTHEFHVGHGGKSNLVRLNGRPLLSTETAGDGDEIQIGETTLVLKVLCTPEFNWSTYEAEGDGHDMAIA